MEKIKINIKMAEISKFIFLVCKKFFIFDLNIIIRMTAINAMAGIT